MLNIYLENISFCLDVLIVCIALFFIVLSISTLFKKEPRIVLWDKVRLVLSFLLFILFLAEAIISFILLNKLLTKDLILSILWAINTYIIYLDIKRIKERISDKIHIVISPYVDIEAETNESTKDVIDVTIVEDNDSECS